MMISKKSRGSEFDYAGAEGEEYHSRRRPPPLAEEWLGRLRAEKIQPYVGAGDAVFEHGVGVGWNLMGLQCRSKAGFDVREQLRPEVESRGIRFTTDLDTVRQEQFDVVICHHTLEHVEHPAKVLGQLREMLASTGRLFLALPFEKERKYQRYDFRNQAHHLYSWTPETLAELLAATGFRLLDRKLNRFRFDRIAGVVACRLRLGEWGYRLIRRAGLALLPEYEIHAVAQRAV